MSHINNFKTLNKNPCYISTTLNIEEVRKAIATEFDWGFLPTAVKDVIKRFSLNTLDIIDMLYKYKYLSPTEIIEIISYATTLPFLYLDLLPKDNVIMHDGYFTVTKSGGSYTDVYMNSNRIISEAQLNIQIAGHIRNVFYLLPTNYYEITTPLELQEDNWDYYILFGRYMFYCTENKASDIHFEIVHINKQVKYRVMCRIGPDREECKLFKFNEVMNREIIRQTVKVRSSNQTALLDLDEGRGVVVSIPDIFSDGNLESRFTAEKVLGGYYCVCRLQETKTVSLTLDELGFDPAIVKLLKETTERPSGLTIITGKIRTGKNTTMASISKDIISRTSNPSLMGLEDPIEILGEYPQVDYRGEISLLKSGIRLAKKLDLDYVTLNEIPNAEVAFGVRDLVNSSIHTMTTWHMNRIWHLPHKLYEYFGESYRDLISQVNIVCNQRLYKRQCHHCLKTIHRDDYVSDTRIHDFFVKYDFTSSLVSQGCDVCRGTGYLNGSIVVLPEVCVFSQELVSELFSANFPYEMEKILFKVMSNSNLSLERQLCKALEDGRLSPRDILSIV